MTDLSNPPVQAGFMRLPEVRQLTGLGRSTIYRRIAEGRFPRPFDLEGERVAWDRSEIAEWIATRRRRDAPS